MSLIPHNSAAYYTVLLHKTLKKQNVHLKIDNTGVELLQEKLKLPFSEIQLKQENDSFYLNKKTQIQLLNSPQFNIWQFKADIIHFSKRSNSTPKQFECFDYIFNQKVNFSVSESGISVASPFDQFNLRLNLTTDISISDNFLVFSSFDLVQSVFQFEQLDELEELQKLLQKELGASVAKSDFALCKHEVERFQVLVNNESIKIGFHKQNLVVRDVLLSLFLVKAIYINEASKQLTFYFYDLRVWKIKPEQYDEFAYHLYLAIPGYFLSKVRFNEVINMFAHQVPNGLLNDADFSMYPVFLPCQNMLKNQVLNQNIDVFRVVHSNLENFKFLIENHVGQLVSFMDNFSSFQKLIIIYQFCYFRFTSEKSSLRQFQQFCFASKYCINHQDAIQIELDNLTVGQKEIHSKLLQILLSNNQFFQFITTTLKSEIQGATQLNIHFCLIICQQILQLNLEQQYISKIQSIVKLFLPQISEMMISKIDEIAQIGLDIGLNFFKCADLDQQNEIINSIVSQAVIIRLSQMAITKSGLQLLVIELLSLISSKSQYFIDVLQKIFAKQLVLLLKTKKLNDFITIVNNEKEQYSADIIWSQKIRLHYLQHLDHLYSQFSSMLKTSEVSLSFNIEALSVNICHVASRSNQMQLLDIDIGNGIYLSGLLSMGGQLLELIGDDFNSYQQKIQEKIETFPIYQYIKKNNYSTQEFIILLWQFTDSNLYSQQISCASFVTITLLQLCFSNPLQIYEQLLRKIIQLIKCSDYMTLLYALALLEIASNQTNQADPLKRNFFYSLGQSQIIELICAKVIPLVVYENFKNSLNNDLTDFKLIQNETFGKLLGISLRILLNTLKHFPAHDQSGRLVFPQHKIYQVILSNSIIPHFMGLILSTFVEVHSINCSKNYNYEVLVHILQLLKFISKQSKSLQQQIIQLGFIEILLSNRQGEKINKYVFDFFKEVSESKCLLNQLLPEPFVNIIYSYPSEQVAEIFCCQFYVSLQVIWADQMRKQLCDTISYIPQMLIDSLCGLVQSTIENQFLSDVRAYIDSEKSFLPIIVFNSIEQHPSCKNYSLLQYCYSSGSMYLNLFSQASYQYLIDQVQPLSYSTHEELMSSGFSLNQSQLNSTICTLLCVNYLDDKNFDSYQYSYENNFLLSALHFMVQKLFKLITVSYKQIQEINQQIGQVNPQLKDQLSIFTNKLKNHVELQLQSNYILMFSLKLVYQQIYMGKLTDDELLSALNILQLFSSKHDLFVSQDFEMLIASSRLSDQSVYQYLSRSQCEQLVKMTKELLPHVLISKLQLPSQDSKIISLIVAQIDIISAEQLKYIQQYLIEVFSSKDKCFQQLESLFQKLFDINSLNDEIIALTISGTFKGDTDAASFIYKIVQSGKSIEYLNKRYKNLDDFQQLPSTSIYAIDYVQNKYYFDQFHLKAIEFARQQCNIAQLNFSLLNSCELFIDEIFYSQFFVQLLRNKKELLPLKQSKAFQVFYWSLSNNYQNHPMFIIIVAVLSGLNFEVEWDIHHLQMVLSHIIVQPQSSLQAIIYQAIAFMICKRQGNIQLTQQQIFTILQLKDQKFDKIEMQPHKFENFGLENIECNNISGNQPKFLSTVYYQLLSKTDNAQIALKYLLNHIFQKTENNLLSRTIQSSLKNIFANYSYPKMSFLLQFYIVTNNHQMLLKFIESEVSSIDNVWNSKVKECLSNEVDFVPDNDQILQHYIKNQPIINFCQQAYYLITSFSVSNHELAVQAADSLLKKQPDCRKQFCNDQWKSILYQNLSNHSLSCMLSIATSYPSFLAINDLLYFVEQLLQFDDEKIALVTNIISVYLLRSNNDEQISKSTIQNYSVVYYLLYLSLSQNQLPVPCRSQLLQTVAKMSSQFKPFKLDVLMSLKQMNCFDSFDEIASQFGLNCHLLEHEQLVFAQYDALPPPPPELKLLSVEQQYQKLMAGELCFVDDERKLLEFATAKHPIEFCLQEEMDLNQKMLVELAYCTLTQGQNWTVMFQQILDQCQ